MLADRTHERRIIDIDVDDPQAVAQQTGVQCLVVDWGDGI